MRIAQQVLSYIAPTLELHQVPEPNGRDTFRHIYFQIGGPLKQNYEVSQPSTVRLADLANMKSEDLPVAKQ